MTLITRLTDEHNAVVQYAQESHHKDGFLDGMKKAIEIVKSHNDWISVDERKPDNGTKVIAYFQHEKNKLFNITELTIFNERYFNDTGNWLNWGDDGNPQYRVTHWQPLPKPPKE